MRSAIRKTYRPPLWGTIGLVIGCAICGTAGFWQLNRADEKRALFEAFELGVDSAAIMDPVADNEADAHLYRRFTLTGRYDPAHQILLDNMVHEGRVGYQVLTPLKIGATVVLVNRGWLLANPDRSIVPGVTVTDNMRVVTGRLNRLPRAGYALDAPKLRPESAWPRRLSFPTRDSIAGQIGFPVADYQLLLEPGEADGYTREWRPALMSPEKHLAYAIQWFMLAGTIVIIYVLLIIRASSRINTK